VFSNGAFASHFFVRVLGESAVHLALDGGCAFDIDFLRLGRFH